VSSQREKLDELAPRFTLVDLASGRLHDNVVLKYPQTRRMRNCKNAISWVPDQLATKAARLKKKTTRDA
jgi:hypothetical protein